MKRKHFADSAEDLDANRHGYMSLSQQNRLRAEFWSQCKVGWTIYLACAVGVIFTALATEGNRPLIPDIVVLVSVLGLVVLIAWFYTWCQWQFCLNDLDGSGVESIVGNISLAVHVSRPSGRLRTYSISLGQFHWAISRDEFSSLSNGDAYRAYYTPRKKMLLSYERAADSRRIPDKSEANPDSVFMGTIEASQRVYLSLANDGELIKVDTDQEK